MDESNPSTEGEYAWGVHDEECERCYLNVAVPRSRQHHRREQIDRLLNQVPGVCEVGLEKSPQDPFRPQYRSREMERGALRGPGSERSAQSGTAGMCMIGQSGIPVRREVGGLLS